MIRVTGECMKSTGVNEKTTVWVVHSELKGRWAQVGALDVCSDSPRGVETREEALTGTCMVTRTGHVHA